MKCDASWHQRSEGGIDAAPAAEVPSLVGLDWLFEHTDSEPDDTPHSNPGEFFYTVETSDWLLLFTSFPKSLFVGHPVI